VQRLTKIQEEPMAVGVGDEAPDFTLKDKDNNEVSLSSFRGQNVALVFYAFAFSGICQGELCDIRDNPKRFAASGTQVIGVSCDSRHALKAWSEQEKFDFPLLADFWPHGDVAKAYGVFNDKLGCANRATFVIDKDGKIIDKFETGEITTAREGAEYDAALSKL
jgi:peroxiredoxin (alkyl hydroperoxide reductase subunit C)